MTRTDERRPGAESEASSENIAAVDSSPDGDAASRPRCLRCGHPLTIARSVARGYGRRCWRRTAVGQLEARRDAVGRSLGRLAGRVASLDVAGLAMVAAGVQDVVEALDAEVTR